jgi:hypothetical protein
MEPKIIPLDEPEVAALRWVDRVAFSEPRGRYYAHNDTVSILNGHVRPVHTKHGDSEKFFLRIVLNGDLLNHDPYVQDLFSKNMMMYDRFPINGRTGKSIVYTISRPEDVVKLIRLNLQFPGSDIIARSVAASPGR